MSTDTTVRFLVVAPDALLEEEFESAIQGVKGRRCVATYVADEQAGVEAARLRQPEFVLIEMAERAADLARFAEEISVVAPDAAVIAMYRRQAFSDPELESNMIIEALRARVVDFLRRPLSTHELMAIVERAGAGVGNGHRRPFGKIVPFISNKGGVGKSTISTNTACELARRHPGRVLLVDLSLQLGVCASMLDLEPTQTITDAAQQLDRLDTTLLQQLAIPHSSGLRVLAAPPTVLAAAEVDERVVSRVLSLARRVYDFVVVDTFPAVDSVTMATLDLSNEVYVVTQVIVPVLNGTASLLETLEHLGHDRRRAGIIVNRGQPAFTGELRPEDVEQHLGLPIAHVVPYEKKIPMSVNMGRPQVLTASRISNFRKAIARIVDEIEALDSAAVPDAPDVSDPPSVDDAVPYAPEAGVSS